MKEQPFEAACRSGSLLVSETRVLRRGAVAWALWRSQIAGVGCLCTVADDDATLVLHLRDGRRFAIEEVAPRACLQLFELFGYEPEPGAVATVEHGDTPRVIELGDGHTRVVAEARSVSLEQDCAPLWSVPGDALLGMRVTIGMTATVAQIIARNGSATLLEDVPFAAALRLFVALGPAPDEITITPLAPPTVSAPAAPPGVTTPPRAGTARAPEPRSASDAHPEPAPTPPGAPRSRRARRKRAAAAAPQQSAHAKSQPAAPLASPEPKRDTSPSSAPSSRKHRAAGAIPSLSPVADVDEPAAPPTATQSRKRATPSTGESFASASFAPAPLSAPAAAPDSNRRPPSPVPVFQDGGQPRREQTCEEESALHTHRERREVWQVAARAGTGMPESDEDDDASTVREAAPHLWQAALTAVARRLARVRRSAASASDMLFPLRPAANLWLFVAALRHPRAIGGTVTRQVGALTHDGPWRLAHPVTARWRLIILAAALIVAAVLVAGAILAADALPAAAPGMLAPGQRVEPPQEPMHTALPAPAQANVRYVGTASVPLATFRATR